MKKFALLFVTILAFSACSPGDIFVDKIEAHNGLVDHMDEVLDAEQAYWDEYIALADGDKGSELSEIYDDFKTTVEALETYYEDTSFHSTQQSFVDSYYKDYKPFVQDYLDNAGDFVEDVNSNGYDYNAMYYYFEDLDQYSYDYVDVHNRLIDIVNLQADDE
jgi:hypothetical protein